MNSRWKTTALGSTVGEPLWISIFSMSADTAEWVESMRYMHGKKPIRIWSPIQVLYGLAVCGLLVVTALAVTGAL